MEVSGRDKFLVSAPQKTLLLKRASKTALKEWRGKIEMMGLKFIGVYVLATFRVISVQVPTGAHS